MLPEPQMGICPKCSKQGFGIEARGWCWDCERGHRTQEQVAKFREQLSGLMGEHLSRGGIGRAELWAKWEDVPAQIVRAIPSDWIGGQWVGFGLGGNTGIGKTMALVAGLKMILARFAEEKIIPSITADGPEKRFPSFQWTCWPSEAHWLRSHAINGAEERVEDLVQARILVLDDLGRERMKGHSSEDYAFSHLDFIITERYRNGAPTVWTTNFKVTDLAQLYGAPTLRRLIEPNPLTWVEGLKPFNLPRRSA